MNKVSCIRQGHLGNQCFIIAATIGYALKHNIEYFIPDYTCNEAFLNYKFFHLLKENRLYTGNQDMFNVRYKETSFAFSEIPKMEGNVLLDGYFQSEKYFQHCIPEVKQLLGFNMDNSLIRVGRSLKNVVGVHVRRGDYLSEQNINKHPFPGLDYYITAIKFLCDQNTTTQFMIFSDDLPWCRGHLNQQVLSGQHGIHAQVNFSDAIYGPYGDMIKLSRCGHHIISNSTFGLFAHIMSGNPEKKIIAPARWFGSDYATLDTRDIYPSSCIKI